MIRDRCTEYALKVFEGKILKGKTEILCCKRHIDDIEKSKNDNFEFYFDVDVSERYIDIINTLNIAEGENIKRLKTRGFQNFIIGSLFGWKNKKTGANRYREAYIQMARQNGKSFISGAIINNFASFFNYKEGRIFCTATKQEQANIVFDEVSKFIRSDKFLNEMYKITEYNKTIKSLVTGSVVKAVGRDTKSMDGFRSILSVVDEYHAHPNNQMYKLVLDGQADVKSALTIAITTAGFSVGGVCHQQYLMCKKIVQGIVNKPSQFVFICELDEDDDIYEPKNWAKASPYRLWNEDDSYNDIKIKVVKEKAVDAKEKGGSELVNFLTKDLNMWVTNCGDTLLNYDNLLACECDMTIEDMKDKECYLGIDLSSGGDLTSIAMLFPLDNDEVFIHHHSFMPINRVYEHETTDNVPYTVWNKNGLVTFTTGAEGIKTDYKFIVSYLKELKEKYNIRFISCGYDPHNAGAFISDLDFLGCDLIEIVQSARSLSDATIDFKLSVDAKKIKYNKNDELYKWCCSNAVTTKNSFGETKVDKTQAIGRIDPIDATIDAWKLYFVKADVIKYNANEDIDEWEELMNSFKR